MEAVEGRPGKKHSTELLAHIGVASLLQYQHRFLKGLLHALHLEIYLSHCPYLETLYQARQ